MLMETIPDGGSRAAAAEGQPLPAAYVGIDVAFRKGKRLPVCVCVVKEQRLVPLPPAVDRSLRPPRGKGNRLALPDAEVDAFSQDVLRYLTGIQSLHRVRIECIAIDAPRDYKKEGTAQRECEKAMSLRGISCFATPSRSEFDEIRRKVERHLAQGGSESTLPHANQLWMLVGFSLFRTLAAICPCVEVYPQAIVAALGCTAGHKTTPKGFAEQLRAVGKETGWKGDDLCAELSRSGFGNKHDRLDAFMSAWIASLSDDRRTPCGVPPSDVIWVPRNRLGSVGLV